MKQTFKTLIVNILTYEAKMLLKRTKPFVIVITGSVGKTSTKDAIYAAIKNNISARKSEKSFNSELGVPLTVLGLPNAWNNPLMWLKNIVDGFFQILSPHSYPNVLVIEAGVDRPGDMKHLASWLKPDVVVLTRLPDIPVHVEYFSRPEEVIAEKMELVKALKPEGILVYNHDDPIVESQLKEVRQQTIGFSRYLPSAYTATADKMVYHDDILVGSECTVSHNNESVVVRIKGTVGEHHSYGIAAALAVASTLDISLADASAGLQTLSFPPGRMRIIPGLKSTTIIDDTYNSSPVAVEAALNALHEVRTAKRRIAVLGDMLELGQFSIQEHERVGALAAKQADILFTLGVRARKIAEGALENGMDEALIFQYEDVMRAGRELQQILEPGDVILIKASQGIRAERVVEEIMADPDAASELLVRQDSAWKRR